MLDKSVFLSHHAKVSKLFLAISPISYNTERTHSSGFYANHCPTNLPHRFFNSLA